MTAPVYSRTSSAIRRLTPLDPEAFHLAIDGAQRETRFHIAAPLARARCLGRRQRWNDYQASATLRPLDRTRAREADENKSLDKLAHT